MPERVRHDSEKLRGDESAVDYAALICEDRVHGSLYADLGVFRDEMTRIFRDGWIFVGHVSEVPNPGDWITRRIGREPVILARDQAGEIHVVANRCAHRGTTLCWSETGNSRHFRCTYHAWTFALDGTLQGVPYPGGFRGERTDYHLDRPSRVAQHRGFVFAKLSPGGPSLPEFLGRGGGALLDRLCDLSPTGNLQLQAGWIGHQVESNWKLWYESNNDGYHFRFVHDSLLAAVGDTHYDDAVLRPEATNPSRAVDYGGGHSELDFRPGYTRRLAWLGVEEARAADYRDALVEARGRGRAERLLWDGPPHAMIFPNLFLGEMNLVVIDPLTPNRTVLRHTAVGFEGVEEAFNRRLLRQSEAALGPGSFIVTDDAVTSERLQRALQGLTPPSASATDWGWVDLSRGIDREVGGNEAGTREAHVSDETPSRAFWRQYRRVMTGA